VPAGLKTGGPQPLYGSPGELLILKTTATQRNPCASRLLSHTNHSGGHGLMKSRGYGSHGNPLRLICQNALDYSCPIQNPGRSLGSIQSKGVRLNLSDVSP
jgi:hypothetical protein